MKRTISILLVTLSSINGLVLINYIIAKREHWSFEADTSYDKCACGGFFGGSNERASLYSLNDKELTSFWLMSIVIAGIGITYVILTNFGKTNNNPLDSLNQENELLKKQIENDELKKRLKGLSQTTMNVNEIGQIQTNKGSDSPYITNEKYNLEPHGKAMIDCPICKAVIANGYNFCPKCGASVVSKPSNQAQKLNMHTIEKGKYSLGIKLTFIWSTILSLLTILFYAFKGLVNTNRAIENLVQGVFARPVVVLLIALIISLFFKPKENQISKFNSASKYIMGILSIGEIGRWFVLSGS